MIILSTMARTLNSIKPENLTQTTLTALALLCLPMHANAEPKLCNGIYTTKPCDSTAVETQASPSESVKSESSKEAARVLSRKRSLLHELTMKNLRAREKFGIKLIIDDVEDYCTKSEVSIEDCAKKITEREDRIDSRVSEAALVQEEQKANKLKAEANNLQKERNDIEATKPTVIVNENRFYHRRPIPPGHRPDGIYQPYDGHYQQNQSSAGISVTAGGSSGNASISVSGGLQNSQQTTITQPIQPPAPTQRAPRSSGSGFSSIASEGEIGMKSKLGKQKK